MKKLNLPAYTSPDTVKWPSHFIGENGIVLASGAFDKDEAPFGSGACAICTCGAPLAGAPPASTCGPADLAAYKPEVPHMCSCELGRLDLLELHFGPLLLPRVVDAVVPAPVRQLLQPSRPYFQLQTHL